SMAFSLYAPGPALMTAHAATQLYDDPQYADTGETENRTMEWSFLVSGDYSESYTKSARHELKSVNADGAKKSITYTDGSVAGGIPLYLVMPISEGSGVPRPAQENSANGYNPETLKTQASTQYYIGKLGMRAAELNSGNTATGANQWLTGGTLTAAANNAQVETTKFGSGGNVRSVESQVVVGKQGNYILVDYYFYGRENLPSAGQDFYVGLAYDFKVDGSLNKDMVITERGFYARRTGQTATVNIILDDPELSVSPASSKWIGGFGSRVRNMLQSGVNDNFMPLSSLTGQQLSNSDYSVSYSWKINLHPGETIHRRVAYTYAEAAIYLSSSHGNDSATGTYDHPVKTFSKAFALASGKNATIFVQDYDFSTSGEGTITVPGLGISKGVTITSSDITSAGASIGYGQGTQTLMREAAGVMFKNNQPVPLYFENITLDGGNLGGALIENQGGTVNLGYNTTLQNSASGAIDIQGGAVNCVSDDDNYPVKALNNKPQDGKGAILVGSAGALNVRGAVKLWENKDAADKRKNVWLASGKEVVVTAPLDSGSRIGVTPQTLPTGSAELVVAKPGSAYPNIGSLSLPPFLGNIEKDDETAAGVVKAAGSAPNNTSVVLKTNNVTVTRRIVNEYDAPITGSPALTPATEQKAVGTAFSYPALTPAEKEFTVGSQSWKFKEVKLDPASTAATVATDGEITGGTVPASDLTISYVFKKNEGKITFHGNGGAPDTTERNGSVGTTTPVPQPAYYGYNLDKWTAQQDGSGAVLAASATTVTFTEAEQHWYAQWTPDPSILFDANAQYSNADGSILFHTSPAVHHPIGATFVLPIASIHGYHLSQADSVITPAKTPPIGSFTATNYSGTMPNQDVAVDFRYTVGSAEADKSDFIVEYRAGSETGPLIDGAGTDGHGTTTLRYLPEEAIHFTPVAPYGFDITDAKLLSGDQPSPASATDHFVSAIKDPDFDGVSYAFSGGMPNQTVKIVYVCSANGTGIPFSVSYRDTGSSDILLRDLFPKENQTHPVGEAFTVPFKAAYGYEYATHVTDPTGLGTVSPVTHDYSVTMPASELNLVYLYSRHNSDWITLTYRGGLGTLAHDNPTPP
ncbi:MAG: hypothetical protein ACTTK0_10430, partial [Stomatobaculum sp.]